MHITWSTRPSQSVVITIFTHIVRLSVPNVQSLFKIKHTSSENNDRYFRECGSNRGDHWWHTSCLTLCLINFYYIDTLFATNLFHMRKMVYWNSWVTMGGKVIARQVSSMISTDRPTVTPIAIFVFSWKSLWFAGFWKVRKDGRNDRHMDERTNCVKTIITICYNCVFFV